MPTLLHLDASPLDTSISRELGRAFVATWKGAHPGATVIYRDLAQQMPAPINHAWVQAAYTPADSRTPEQIALLAPSDALIEELKSVDEIVIGMPMHNFSIPASLKLWIDQVVRSGETFSFGTNHEKAGAKGLVQVKKATLLVATGGVYTPGTPLASYDFGEPYLKTVLGFIGIPEVRTLSVSGVSRLITGAIDRTTLLQPTLEQIRAIVA